MCLSKLRGERFFFFFPRMFTEHTWEFTPTDTGLGTLAYGLKKKRFLTFFDCKMKKVFKPTFFDCKKNIKPLKF